MRSLSDPPPARALTGVGGGAVQLITAGELGVWASPSGGEAASAERLREHEMVVRSALRSATPIPFRFGTTFRDVGDLARRVGLREAEFLRMLDEFAGRVEMGVRVSLPEEEHPSPKESASAPSDESAIAVRPAPNMSPSPGRAHLEARRGAISARLERERRIGKLLDEVESELADLELPAVRSIVGTVQPFGSLAHLVHRDRISAYRTRVADIEERRRSELRVLATGPWAPYSFVN